jgi:hypothetical protein
MKLSNRRATRSQEPGYRPANPLTFFLQVFE